MEGEKIKRLIRLLMNAATVAFPIPDTDVTASKISRLKHVSLLAPHILNTQVLTAHESLKKKNDYAISEYACVLNTPFKAGEK